MRGVRRMWRINEDMKHGVWIGITTYDTMDFFCYDDLGVDTWGHYWVMDDGL